MTIPQATQTFNCSYEAVEGLSAKVLGIDQPEISNLKLGKYSRFKVERLFNFLNRLNLNIDIMISKAKRGQPRQRIVEQKSNHNSSGV